MKKAQGLKITIEELATRVLPYIEGYDLTGTGPGPSKAERDEFNTLLSDLYDIVGTVDEDKQ